MNTERTFFYNNKNSTFAGINHDMKNLFSPFHLILFSVSLLFLSCNSTGAKTNDVKLKNEIDSISYALGQNVADFYKNNKVTEIIDTEIFIAAIRRSFENKDGFSEEELQNAMFGIQNLLSEKAAQREEEFLKENAKKDGVITTASGLQYEIIEEGSGEKPVLESIVSVLYTGKLTDGSVFDSSADNTPTEFPLENVVPGWQEGVQLMSPGAKYILYIPSNLGYGEMGAGGGLIGPHETLIFEVELVSFK